MRELTIPAFDEKCSDYKESRNARSVYIPNAGEDSFANYCELLEKNDFVKREETFGERTLYAAYQKDECGIFLNYFCCTGELLIVIEEACNYFSYTDGCGRAIVAPQITQLYLENFGMSYVVRLSDGRFLLIDGGWEFEPDADRLFRFLKESSPYDKPVIAAWIMTHPHEDHYQCLFPFMDKYAGEVTIEKFLYNFPLDEGYERYPDIYADNPNHPNVAANIGIPKMLAYIEQTHAVTYTPHTGQRFVIGDAVLDIYSSMDDTIHHVPNLNAASLTIRMELGGQVILWGTDANFYGAKLAERYGSMLAADILQVPHHGFGAGSVESEIQCYELIKPKVCLMPVNDYNAYTFFNVYCPGTRYLMEKMNVEEMITGETTRTLTLPYTARENGACELKKNLQTGLDNSGARTWIFTGLRTDRQEDFVFDVLNATLFGAKISIQLFFEDQSRKVCDIITVIPGSCYKQICIIDETDVDVDAFYFNPCSLVRRGIPEAVPFAVQFISDRPVVISHRDHAASYHSTIN